MKNVPVKSVPPLPMWQAGLAIRPPGEVEIVHDVSPLLNCPGGKFSMDTSTVVPGVAGGPGVNPRVGVSSTLNIAGRALLSPVLPVTVIPYGSNAGLAPEATVNEPETTPELDTLQLGDAIMFAGVDVIMHGDPESIPLKAVPCMVIFVALGPSDGVVISCGPVGGGATMNDAPAEMSPKDPFTVTA